MIGDDPEEAAADRRARRMPMNGWLVISVIVLIGMAAYAASAVLA